jgi:DeoR/GlpR family transcriptional regulator of sugar metabolism
LLVESRQVRILEELQNRGSLRVADLAEIFQVSDMTIRRDLDRLHHRGLLKKVHGGAMPIGHSTEEPGFESKRPMQRTEKLAIARTAAGLIEEGNSIALSAGTTTWYLAEAIADITDVTVVTNSTNIALELNRNRRYGGEIILTGGIFRTPSDALVGPVVDASIESLNVDILFLGVHGMDANAGFTTPNLAEAQTNKAMISRAHRLVVLADHTKWGVVGLCSMAPLSAATTLVTDSKLDDEARSLLAEEVGELMVADSIEAVGAKSVLPAIKKSRGRK